MPDYGNARIAARRSRLLDEAALEQLAQSGSPAGALSLLERRPGWSELLRAARQAVHEPAATMELAIELFRATELSQLPRWYSGRTRRLVEALVLDLDLERVLALVRRRRAGQDAEAINPTITRGALLDGAALVELARQPNRAALVSALGQSDLIDAGEAARLARTSAGLTDAELEAALGVAWARAKRARADGAGPDAAFVRRLLDEEDAERRSVAEELSTGGSGVGALVERGIHLARLDRVAAKSLRDPGGIGPVAAYVAAVEAQAIRLRTVLARLSAGWSVEMARSYLAGAGA